jgi:hypothetical protein
MAKYTVVSMSLKDEDVARFSALKTAYRRIQKIGHISTFRMGMTFLEEKLRIEKELKKKTK